MSNKITFAFANEKDAKEAFASMCKFESLTWASETKRGDITKLDRDTKTLTIAASKNISKPIKL